MQLNQYKHWFLFQNTALHHACNGGYEDVVEFLLDQQPQIIENNEKKTPLEMALEKGFKHLARLYINDKKLFWFFYVIIIILVFIFL